MKLDLKKNQLHKVVGKAPPGLKITQAEIAKEKSKAGVFARRAQSTVSWHRLLAAIAQRWVIGVA